MPTINVHHITEVRQEAVQQALAALKNRPKPSLPMPSKRSSVLNRSPDRDRDDSGKCLRARIPPSPPDKHAHFFLLPTGSPKLSPSTHHNLEKKYCCFRIC